MTPTAGGAPAAGLSGGLLLMSFATTPTWVWGFVVITMLPPIALLGLLFLKEVFGPRASAHIQVGDTSIELWGKPWNRPPSAEAIIVPVAPDMQLVNGIAKWARDSTANRLQDAAEHAAPLAPGEAFIGPGGKFKFQLTALAVVMDESNQTTADWIERGIVRAMIMAREKEARAIVLPDFTDDMLRQPANISDEQRRETSTLVAKAMIQALLDNPDCMEEVKIWVWRAETRDIFLKEMDRLKRPAFSDTRTAALIEGAH